MLKTLMATMQSNYTATFPSKLIFQHSPLELTMIYTSTPAAVFVTASMYRHIVAAKIFNNQKSFISHTMSKKN